jgi:hypothetical protein
MFWQFELISNFKTPDFKFSSAFNCLQHFLGCCIEIFTASSFSEIGFSTFSIFAGTSFPCTAYNFLKLPFLISYIVCSRTWLSMTILNTFFTICSRKATSDVARKSFF